jgi:hypothetical protein
LITFSVIYEDCVSKWNCIRVKLAKTRNSNFVISGLVRQRLQCYSAFSNERWSTYQESVSFTRQLIWVSMYNMLSQLRSMAWRHMREFHSSQTRY